MTRAARPLPTLTQDEQREAAMLAANTRLNPAAIERLAAEVALLRSVVCKLRRLPYVRTAPPVRPLLDRLPRPL